MAQQKSERRIVPQTRRKSGPTTAALAKPWRGKATPVKQQTLQLQLTFETAEAPRAKAQRDHGGLVAGIPASGPLVAPKSKSKAGTVASAMMGRICERLDIAFRHVAANRGAPGPDRQSIEGVREHLPEVLSLLMDALLSGSYRPGDIRRVWIPKAGGGERGLGIPNVIDRVVQEAVRLVLEPLYEPTFHQASHGFRPGRSCHTALDRAKGFLADGYDWVVDLDLERFFDRVNHQRLMARLAERVHDKPVLELIGRMIRARIVLPDGVVVATEEGVPQGGPLSPLLSNIVLDELDRELARRGHRFVRYADDCNIYVRSEHAGQRVMESVVRFIEGRMRLKVNLAKSAVARPEQRHFVGFRLRREPLNGDVNVSLSKRSQERLDARIRELTPRNWGNSLDRCIKRINVYFVGWLGFFGVCTAVQTALHEADAHIRRRLRALQLKHWKRKKTIVHRLIKLGVRAKTAWRNIYEGRHSLWKLSHCSAVHRGLDKAYFAKKGLVSLEQMWKDRFQQRIAPVQLRLALG